MGYIRSIVEKVSHWQEPIYKETRRPTIHIIASLLYVACMGLYAIYAFHDFATYEPATLFSSLPTNSLPPVGLKSRCLGSASSVFAGCVPRRSKLRRHCRGVSAVMRR
ncbi:hypothetical protein TL16_g04922 [Triparma laevis f. inornata]|uniref:Uncharacterized protein n=2 Tax=Triparma laevis TaxID=1534972 RepID=A0A9W7A1R4_9STRA|nr:hypothetical protein TrLO_g14685 [Triparma laevis f. longispina]GMH68403.1 hypothetical protein TL16_g04922 [Triparma laevis f. inornata]